MANPTRIDRFEATWNPVIGCSALSPGCDNCYAARQAARLTHREEYAGLAVMDTPYRPRWTGKIQCIHQRLDEPFHWKKPKHIFVSSMGDLFHEQVPDSFLLRCFQTMHDTHRHTYIVMTKRASRMKDFVSRLSQEDGQLYLDHPLGMTPDLENIWLGTSVEDAWNASQRVPALKKTPAAIRFLWCEPLLSRLDLPDLDGIDWVVVGGETGPGPRKMNPDWARHIRDQCRNANVPFFMKQMSGQDTIPTDLMIQEWPKTRDNDVQLTFETFAN